MAKLRRVEKPELVWLCVPKGVDLNLCVIRAAAAAYVKHEIIIQSTCNIDIAISNGNELPLLIRRASRPIDGIQLHQGPGHAKGVWYVDTQKIRRFVLSEYIYISRGYRHPSVRVIYNSPSLL